MTLLLGALETLIAKTRHHFLVIVFMMQITKRVNNPHV